MEVKSKTKKLNENHEQKNRQNDIKSEVELSKPKSMLSEIEEQQKKLEAESIETATYKPLENEADILAAFKAFKSQAEEDRAFEAECERAYEAECENHYDYHMKLEEEMLIAEEELKAVLETKECYKNSYNVKVGLRNKFKNSFFLEEIYDDLICGLNPISESIIYDFSKLDNRTLYYSISDLTYGLYDNIFIFGEENYKLEKLTSEELEGKVKPTFIFWLQDMRQWPEIVETISRGRDLPF